VLEEDINYRHQHPELPAANTAGLAATLLHALHHNGHCPVALLKQNAINHTTFLNRLEMLNQKLLKKT
jgi:hypothetical protein